jgi:hypothetical protein
MVTIWITAEAYLALAGYPPDPVTYDPCSPAIDSF